MRTADPGGSFITWRDAARTLLAAEVPPQDILWEAGGLFVESPAVHGRPLSPSKVPPDFVKLAKEVSCHREPGRWALLYRLLWRITRGGERHLLEIASDPDVSTANTLAKAVRREIHKMHAFVRFKLISTDEATGRERYAAWFEPDHHVVEAASPFFRDRFTGMDWSIFTPKGCAHWLGGHFSYSPGIAENPVDDADALEAAWSTYYRSIFNPARLKVKMMRQEMPKRYWKNLPEAIHIPELIEGSRPRTERMISTDGRAARPAPALAYLARLEALSGEQPVTEIPDNGSALPPFPELRKMAANCRACPLWENATCTVFGEGPEGARVMIIGEQPGDREDIAGKAFVGPAGKLLDEALAAAGIDRAEAYVTNAVKHFKWKPRGKVRLHQKPDTPEIEACRPWVLAELKNVAPEVIILLGGTAAQSLLGKLVQVTKMRGEIPAPHLAAKVILTVHPSYLLRLPGEDSRRREFQKFVDDLRLAANSQ